MQNRFLLSSDGSIAPKRKNFFLPQEEKMVPACVQGRFRSGSFSKRDPILPRPMSKTGIIRWTNHAGVPTWNQELFS
ncbi:hypothetical protein LEP1GSC193_3390 [Leptospira alstonii serovar Pingchang str. 80-412]|uniref:Uncharacterized protein n=1 Tax=Leptospira alstonii serovar Pingchang str. 80-412 TaxID=1218564 RepID=T0G780_9LEPT|nr:hypothetical protein LEP1GSC193_3390 [Leptospira alstonii serovar Pingchang str. 80-412]